MRAWAVLAILTAGAAAAQEADITVEPSPAATGPIAFLCDDGREVTVAYTAEDTAVLTVDGTAVEMTHVESGSGARYLGGGWEWWGKGMDQATLSPVAEGEDAATGAGTLCTTS